MNKHWLKFALQMLVANTLLAYVLWFFAGNPQLWLKQHALVRFLHVMDLLVLGGGVYLATLWLLGIRWRHYRLSTD